MTDKVRSEITISLPLDAKTTRYIYTYSRVSSKKQLRGTGKEQQEQRNVLEKLSAEHQLPLAENIISDDGVSSFDGSNVETGELGQFIKAVHNGDIAKGSILAVFSLDRLSRQKVDISVEMLLSITNRDVRVYSTINGMMFGGNEKTAFSGLMESVITFHRAYDESAHKSSRTVGHALTMIRKHKNRQDDESGDSAPVKAIQSVGNHPWWIDVNENNEVVYREGYEDVVKDVASKILSGWGSGKIVDYLNEKGIKQPVSRTYLDGDGNPIKKKMNNGWSKSIIDRIHLNDALAGDHEIKLKGVPHKLEGYFPAVISKGELYQLREARKNRAFSKSDAKRASFITGNGISVCRLCGGPVRLQKHRNGEAQYLCGGRYHSRKLDENGNPCPGWSVLGRKLETEILRLCHQELIKASHRKVDNNSNQVSALKLELENVKEQIEYQGTVMGMVKDKSQLPEIAERYNSLGEQRAELERQLEKERVKEVMPTSSDTLKQWDVLTENTDPLDPDNYDIRFKLRELMPMFVDKIEISPVGQRVKGRGYKRFRASVYFKGWEETENIKFILFSSYSVKDLK